MIAESQRRDCPKCGLSVAIAPFNGSLLDHRCHHGKRCSVFDPPCEQCKTHKAPPGQKAEPPRCSIRESMAGPLPQIQIHEPKAAPKPSVPSAGQPTVQRSLFGEPEPPPAQAKEPQQQDKEPPRKTRAKRVDPLPHNAPHVAGSDTSKAAAESIDGAVLNDLQLQVLEMIISAPGGCTCDEVEQTLFLRHQTASARVNELAKAGYIEDSGDRRNTSSGRKATVWKATRRAAE